MNAPDQTWAIWARTEIEKLFGDARETVGHECAAYVEWATGDAVFPVGRTSFVTICNGHLKPEGVESTHWPDMELAARGAVAEVRRLFPRTGQRLLWRRAPIVEFHAAQPARDGLAATRARYLLYMRLGAVPIYINEFLPRVT